MTLLNKASSTISPHDRPMRILIVSDAWEPQVNGVVRTLQAVRAELVAMGHTVGMITPDQYRSMPCPTYPEIRLAMTRPKTVGERIKAFQPDAIHLSTEGPLCLAARRWCLVNRVPFTTAYHTQFPDYVAKRTGLPARAIWPYIRWFHGPAQAVLASTPQIREELRAQGITHLAHWGRGVDMTLFRPDGPKHPAVLAAIAARAGEGEQVGEELAPQLTPASPPETAAYPVQLYVGRVAVEKNIEAFLKLPKIGIKLVVGDGPARAALEARYPDVLFLGALSGEELAAAYRSAQVFVFPSLTDTFGLVMVEALASGVPVAAYPVTGPTDVLGPLTKALHNDLEKSLEFALLIDPAACIAHARNFSWRASAEQFLEALAPIPSLSLA
ncbi:glycosyltransferase family 4 protein [Pseudonocardia sp. TMWB2A]|uniref:glycosyltransferase family 4 protein n=1 Tax=Pseudonocardia sp. TMWB2A TaxID=687430 RepID=UPI00307CE489